ncbi:MAG: transglycosylase SLT domain-containing protein [Mizugakiibacter sp.]|uniref:transglycosylase SLT domain-containing protein n=1 Tax=Mizugakiibacter sp. TaxID=1972610 RepID=UPI0031BEE121|nr:transglycosylase SLT domain-containing protein [Xanthomonadaceae bacterium]
MSARQRLHVRLLLTALALAAPFAAADDDAAQRDVFRQAYALAQDGDPGWKRYAPQLEDYPLYPYLEAAALEHDLARVDRAAVEAYLTRWPDLIPAAELRRDFLQELARRRDWGDFLALYDGRGGDTLACAALQARLAQGATLDFERDLAALWQQPRLPDACDPVLDWARQRGLLTGERVWARIERAAGAGAAGTVAALAPWLPADEQDAARRIADALRDPAAAMAAATAWPDAPRSRMAVALGMPRLARSDSGRAEAAWNALAPRFAFPAAERDRILAAIALYRATDFDDDAAARLAALPADAQTDATREWRVRVALAARDWSGALAALDALSPTQAQDAEWRYLRARVLDALGRKDEARPLYEALARDANFYGFLAADRVGAPYAICPETLAADDAGTQRVLALPGMRRAFEFHALDLLPQARREWARAWEALDPAGRRLAADLAYRRGWYDRALFAFSSGDALRLYEQRFPLAREQRVLRESRAAGIDPAWAYAIIRAESAWVADARSGADARGLMQLLPKTAEQLAHAATLPYAGPDSLFDPAVNIPLGTRYLARLEQRYGNPWLASAAYNAGPDLLNRWLSTRGDLPPDLFIATIPYRETREYVARILAFSVIYDWRMHGQALALSTRMPASGQDYAPPTADAARRPVVCPAPPAAESAGSAVTQRP